MVGRVAGLSDATPCASTATTASMSNATATRRDRRRVGLRANREEVVFEGSSGQVKVGRRDLLAFEHILDRCRFKGLKSHFFLKNYY